MWLDSLHRAYILFKYLKKHLVILRMSDRNPYIFEIVIIFLEYEMKLMHRYLLVLILLGVFCIVPAIAQTTSDYWAPWVTETTTSSATINWRA